MGENITNIPRTYKLISTSDGSCIHCLICGAESYHPEDIRDKLCPRCDAPHALLARRRATPSPPAPSAPALVRITSRDQVNDFCCQPCLVGIVTSGDHPIDWQAYASWLDWVHQEQLDWDDVDDINDKLESWLVFELPYSVSYHRRADMNPQDGDA